MKPLRILVACLTVGAASMLLSADEKPAPTMPDVVTLKSGRVLRNVQVVRWEKDRVVLKYTGGVDPIAFSLIKEPSAGELDAIRAGAKKAESKINLPTNRAITGQIFVTTRGAGAYKFAGAKVIAFPLGALESMRSTVEGELASARAQKTVLSDSNVELTRYYAWLKAVQNFTPVAEVTADADGLYRITVSAKQPVFIFCATTRIAGSTTEYNVWTVPLEGTDRLDLNGSNQLQ